MTRERPPVETAFAFSAHPNPATATGEVVGVVHDSGVMATTVLGLFAGSWPTGSRHLAWRTVCRVLRPEVAVAGALPEILHPRSEVPALSDRRRHRSLAVIATDNGPAEIVASGGEGEPIRSPGSMITFTGWEVTLTKDSTGPPWNDTTRLERSPSVPGSFRRFLTIGTDTGDGAAVVRFDPTDVSLLEFQGVRSLRTDLQATIDGREVTSIDNRPGLDVVAELTSEIERPDLRPETLLIGAGERWYRIVAVDRTIGSLILAAPPDRTVDGRSDSGLIDPATITVAVPDLLDAVIAVDRRIAHGQRPLLAVSAHYLQQPNEFGADHDVHDVAGGLASLIVPSPGLAPGAVRALVFGAPPVR